ncbi:hypothetical protein CHELA1G11_11409 [Hyphomicrobiales bacterium]|nr:hypothetical protein CHELA1G11_11409 [Hyphomicrobiales bacterium]CAH1667967.1 hypothetical protein CHELA1G2_12900 [Hyphomicrobiales bacterium]
MTANAYPRAASPAGPETRLYLFDEASDSSENRIHFSVRCSRVYRDAAGGLRKQASVS